MSKKQYTQLTASANGELAREIQEITSDAITQAMDAITSSEPEPSSIHNRHEAYGVAAEHYSKMLAVTKSIGKDLDGLLSTLPRPKYSAVEAMSSVVNGVMALADAAIEAAAQFRRTLSDLYEVEEQGHEEPAEYEQASLDDSFDEAPANEEEE